MMMMMGGTREERKKEIGLSFLFSPVFPPCSSFCRGCGGIPEAKTAVFKPKTRTQTSCIIVVRPTCILCATLGCFLDRPLQCMNNTDIKYRPAPGHVYKFDFYVYWLLLLVHTAEMRNNAKARSSKNIANWTLTDILRKEPYFLS